jgi:acetate kinase
MLKDAILVLNAGSSSLKFQVFSPEDGLTMHLRGQIEGIGRGPRFIVRNATGALVVTRALNDAEARDHAAALSFVASWLRQENAGSVRLAAVGHRVSHGGLEFIAPVRVDRAVLARLEAYSPLAPLHQPFNLAPMRRLLDVAPELPQVACFDTSFHATQPVVAKLFGLPKALYDEGVRRYGFHGISYEYIARVLPELAPEVARSRVVVAHLGSGASMCAMLDLKSIANTFGFTAIDGLPMGTRSGALDPGVILYLARERGMSIAEIEALLYRQSGLLGLSGISNDVRVLLQSTDPNAALALDYFVYRVSRELGSLAAALGGLDALVFTAGIGENNAELRARIVRRAAWLGVELGHNANAAGATLISSAESRVAVWVIPTNEELMIAEHALALLQ